MYYKMPSLVCGLLQQLKRQLFNSEERTPDPAFVILEKGVPHAYFSFFAAGSWSAGLSPLFSGTAGAVRSGFGSPKI